MKAMTCKELGFALNSEWACISSERRSRGQLRDWSAVEPDLAGLTSLQQVVEAIAVPIGMPAEESMAITKAVIRLAASEPLASRLLLQVMVPIMMKESYRSLKVVRMCRVNIDDGEIVSLVLLAANDAIASVAGTTLDWPLRNLHRRMVKRLIRRREKLIANARELLEYLPPEQAAPLEETTAAELLAQTLDLAMSRGIVSSDDARLVWASSFWGETSFTLAHGNMREAERLRRRRSRAQQRLAAHSDELIEVIAV